MLEIPGGGGGGGGTEGGRSRTGCDVTATDTRERASCRRRVGSTVLRFYYAWLAGVAAAAAAATWNLAHRAR